jgi:alkylated DNA repair dioxygenase AlkB
MNQSTIFLWERRAGAEYLQDLVGGPLSKTLMEELLQLKWRTDRDAREEYFMSDKPRTYSYGNRRLGEATYESEPFNAMVATLLDYVNYSLASEFNVCFLNKYNDQHNHLGWHADDFPGMREDQPIAVISLGAEREIWVKPKDQKGPVPQEQRFLLNNGSVFVMPPGFQKTHLHKIPKCDRPCDIRISLTFRSFV